MNKRRSPFFHCCGLCLVLVTAMITAPALADTPLHKQIDQLIEKKSPNFSQIAAPLADDAEFVRRIYLDFTGMIPSATQAREFFADKSPDKRAKLIDGLLKSDEYARNMQYKFDVLWMQRRPDKHVKSGQWQDYLRNSFAKNKPYDQLVKEILSSDGEDKETRAAAKFYLDRLGEPNDITKDISRLFLGMNLECAQCHDHPIVDAYKQDHYYGIYAFFNRSYLFNDKAKKQTILAEKAVGEVKFESVFKPKVSKETGPRLPDMAPIKEPDFAKGKEYKVAPAKNKRGIPKFSRREQLAGALASANNVRFKRAAANRLWYMMIGRGIVHPVDYDHPDNPPSHPELLDLLAEKFAAMKFDMKAYLREIALSDAYQRSSRMPSGKELPPADSFALAELRSLSPEQLAWSVMQATGIRENQVKALGKKATEAAVYGKLAGNVSSFIKIFGSEPGTISDGFESTLDQTLFLRNGPLVRGWLTPRTGSLTHRLLQLKDADAFADELFLSVLTRLPSESERKSVAQFLEANQSNRTEAIQEIAWALLASAEFRFNH